MACAYKQPLNEKIICIIRNVNMFQLMNWNFAAKFGELNVVDQHVLSYRYDAMLNNLDLDTCIPACACQSLFQKCISNLEVNEASTCMQTKSGEFCIFGHMNEVANIIKIITVATHNSLFLLMRTHTHQTLSQILHVLKLQQLDRISTRHLRHDI